MTALGADATVGLPRLEHRNIDRHEPGWEGVREGVEGDAGWPPYLARYADLLSKVS